MSVDLVNAYAAAFLTAGIGIYPYLRKSTEVTKYFALANGTLALWNLDQVLSILPISHEAALTLYRVFCLSSVYLVIFFFRFMIAFMDLKVESIPRLWLGIKTLCAFLTLVVLTPLFVKEITLHLGLPIQVVYGVLFPIYPLYLLGILGYALYRLYTSFRVSEGQRRVQFKYMFTALSVVFVEAIVFFLSVTYFTIQSYYYYLQVIYVLIIAYAILAHHLMNINVIIRKTAIYSVVTGMLTAVYLLIATLLFRLLENAGGRASFWSSAIAAAVITLLFQPLLNRVRSYMDRKFFGDWLRDMSRGVIHEVKRPLASISMPAQLTLLELEDIENGKLSIESVLPEFKERMRGIVQKTMEAADRIEALYALSDSSGRQVKPIEVRSLIEESLSAAKGFLDQYPVRLSMEVAVDLPAVKGDSRQFEIVFVNLIKNATEAMASLTERALTFGAYEEDKWVVFSIKDSGPGISASDRDHLFDPHFTTKGSNGMGLGLYLSEKIVRENGGSIEVRSEEGKGTEFIVRLPKYSGEGHTGVHVAA